MGKIITVILTLGVGTSKNKNIGGKETCVYESDHISLLCYLTMSSVLKFCFLSTLINTPPPKKIILEEK